LALAKTPKERLAEIIAQTMLSGGEISGVSRGRGPTETADSVWETVSECQSKNPLGLGGKRHW